MPLKEISDKGVTVAWSPSPAASSLLAMGTKEGAGRGFDEYGGDLELYDVDFTQNADTECPRIGGVKTTQRCKKKKKKMKREREIGTN